MPVAASNALWAVNAWGPTRKSFSLVLSHCSMNRVFRSNWKRPPGRRTRATLTNTR